MKWLFIGHSRQTTNEQWSQLQNISGDFTNSKVRVKARHVDDTRRCTTTAIFSRRAKNDAIVKRSWLCYSPLTGRVYCYICKRMSPGRQQSSGEGYCDRTRSAERLKKHELSTRHAANVITLAQRSNALGRIDRLQQQQVDKSHHHWRNILKRCISVMWLLAERGLAFRDEDEILTSPSNGNYLRCLGIACRLLHFPGRTHSFACEQRQRSYQLINCLCAIDGSYRESDI